MKDQKKSAVASVCVMRESDAATIRGGISGRQLMRRAGEGIYASYPWRGKVAIVAGYGNNAGDGYVLATLLHQEGIPCSIILLNEIFSPDGEYYYRECVKAGVEICRYTPDFSFDGYCEIVDCIFGTGFHGSATGVAAQVIEKINQSGKAVVSVDINSGMNGDSGLGSPCVRSTLTVSIGSYKQGHFLGNAKDVIGSLTNVDIGIDLIGKTSTLFDETDAKSVFPKRPRNSHKGSYGYVSILGGCREYAGAVKLANLSCAALRSGCGVAQLILPESLAQAVAPYLLESTLALFPDEGGHMIFDPALLDRILCKQVALALGMGWGRSPENERILRHILKTYAIPLVIDADGLNTLAVMEDGEELLKKTACKVILTPHPLEFSRLSGLSTEEILKNPVKAAEEYAKKGSVCVLLKGACTVVTDGDVTYLVDRGSAGMATAGSGDVLSGILAGLLGFAPPTPITVAAGAYLAGRAGEAAASELGEVSMMASDTVRMIPSVIKALK